MTLATTGSNALRHRVNGLGRVLYWTYTKYPLGEAWEAYFPTTIYLVGCNPPFSVSLYCTGDSTKKVLYHSDDTCSVTNPGGDYVISYDRRAYCPIDLSEICEEGEDPPEGIVVVEKTTVPLCITFDSDYPLTGSKWYTQPETGALYWCSGCVEPRWRNTSGGCLQYGYDVELIPGPFTAYNGEMTGNSTIGWSRGPIYISPDGEVSFGYWITASGPNYCYPYWITFGVGYGGTGSDIALDASYNCPVGVSTIPVLASYVHDSVTCSNPPFSRACCPEGTMCDGHEYVCDAGSITITTAIKVGSC